jgi:hypothetical protein
VEIFGLIRVSDGLWNDDGTESLAEDTSVSGPPVFAIATSILSPATARMSAVSILPEPMVAHFITISGIEGC